MSSKNRTFCQRSYFLPVGPTRKWNYFFPQSLFFLSEQYVTCAVRPEYLKIIQVKFTRQWTLLWLRQFIPWPFMTEPRVQFLISPCDTCGGPSGTGSGIPPSTSVFACQFHPTNASSACCRYQKHKREKPRNISKSLHPGKSWSTGWKSIFTFSILHCVQIGF